MFRIRVLTVGISKVYTIVAGSNMHASKEIFNAEKVEKSKIFRASKGERQGLFRIAYRLHCALEDLNKQETLQR